MYTKLSNSLSQAFHKKAQHLDKLSVERYMKLVEELKMFQTLTIDDINKKDKNVFTPHYQKKTQFDVIKSILQQSGAYVLPVENDDSNHNTLDNGLSPYTHSEITKALKDVPIRIYNKQSSDTTYDSCIAHGGYTLLQKMNPSDMFFAIKNVFYKVKDTSGNIRMLHRIPFFPRRFQNAKKAIDDLRKRVLRELNDTTGRIKVLTSLAIVPKVHDCFICLSHKKITTSDTADFYVVQDYVPNALGLNEYIQQNQDKLNRESLENIKRMMLDIIKKIHSQTSYRYTQYNSIQYLDFLCEMNETQTTILKIYLKRPDTLLHIDDEEEAFEKEQNARLEREKVLSDQVRLLVLKTMQKTESTKMDIAVMQLVQENVLRIPAVNGDIVASKSDKRLHTLKASSNSTARRSKRLTTK